jgi:DNA replication protein DnaC
VSACQFGVCDGSGFVYDMETNTASDCRCRAQRISRARSNALAAPIPKRYRDVSFDRTPVTEIDTGVVRIVRAYADRIGDLLAAGRGLWLMGPQGTGKTTLAMLVSKAALAAGHTVAIYPLPKLLYMIRESFGDGRSHMDLIDRLTAVDLLHIDDIGAEQTTPWVLEELYTIVNARYEEQRSMLITTNIMDRDELCEQITPRTVSRLTEMCDELPLLGHDHRMDLRTA